MKNLYLTYQAHLKTGWLGLKLCILLVLSATVTNAQNTPRVVNLSGIGGYMEHLPKDYATSGKTYPLLVFFHGLGEEGNGTTDINKVIANGPPKMIANGTWPETFTVNKNNYSFIVISPQCSGPVNADQIQALLTYLKANYRVDLQRVYLTGLSRGGGEVWGYTCVSDAYSKSLAAVVPISGNYDLSYNPAIANYIARNNLPVWALHNLNDPTVPSDWSKNWVKYINAYVPAANPQAKLTIFNASGHDAWSKAYDPAYRENGMNVYEWMLQYTNVTPHVTIPPDTTTTTPPADTVVTPPAPTPPASTGGKRIGITTNNGNGFYYPDAMKSLGISPGDTLCIAPGDYGGIYLGNLIGTAAKPIVVINCGGLVRFGINNTSGGGTTVFNMETCKFVEVSGQGAPGLEYGFDINGTNTLNQTCFGMYWGTGSTDFDIHNVKIHDAAEFIVAKTLQDCTNSQYWDGNFIMQNVKIHHVYGDKSTWEGFYIGNSHYDLALSCGTVKSHRIKNIQIYDNVVMNTGNDGIQLCTANEGTNLIHDNYVYNYGLNKDVQQAYGLLMGEGSTVEVYRNRIDKGFSTAITLFGSGISKIYNNVISNINAEGVLVADRLIFLPATAYIYNNTMVNTLQRGAIIYANTTTIGHKVYNNLLVTAGGVGDYPATGYYFRGATEVKFDFQNNLTYKTADLAGFVNAAVADYHLTAGSKAVDAGLDVSSLGLTADYDNTARPVNAKYDVGAFEYHLGGANQAPVPNAGSNITINLPTSTASLDGSASKDNDGTISTYAWAQVSGPGTSKITTPAAAKTTVTGLIAGTYVYSLTVTDNAGAKATANVTVLVVPAAPVASAGSDITITLPTNSTTLDASGSTSGSAIKTYAWTKVSGPTSGTITTAAAAKTTVTALVAGTYVFKITVTDATGATSTDQVTVQVNNAAPVANAGTDITITLPVNSVTLNGSASAATAGIKTYAWKTVSGPAAAPLGSPSLVKSNAGPLIAGQYVFQLTITDNSGAQSTDQVKVTVNAAPPHTAPVAQVAAKDLAIQLPVSTVTVDGSTSYANDGETITSYAWSKLSGGAGVITSVSAAKTTITGLVAGTYTFQLLITDSKGLTGSTTVTVTVTAAGHTAPVAKVASADISIQLPIKTARVDASSSYANDGETITGYAWTQTSGTAVTIANASAAITDITFTVAGVYTFQVKVTDSKGLTATTTVRIAVLAASSTHTAPVAKITSSSSAITLPTNSVNLDGSASYANDGETIVSYAWGQTAGGSGSFTASGSSKTAFTGMEVGTYTFQLTVTDSKGLKSTSTVNVTVSASSNPTQPAFTVSAGGDKTIKLPTDMVSVTATSSIAGTTFAWKQTSGPFNSNIINSSSATAVMSNLAAGVFTFRVTGISPDGRTATDDVTITVQASDLVTVSEYPNPATTSITLNIQNKTTPTVIVNIYSIYGVKEATYRYDLGTSSLITQIDVSKLAVGYHIVEMLDTKGQRLWMAKVAKVQQ